MNSNIIKPGDKIEIRILQQVEQGKRTGEQPPAYYSRVENVLEDGMIEVLVPIREGKTASPPSGVRLEFIFYTKTNMYRCIARIKNRYIKENLYLMLVEPRSPLEKFQRREYYRFECVMDMQYMKITEEEAEIEKVTDAKEHHRLEYPEDLSKDAIAVDISGGGIRFVGDEPGNKGDYLIIAIRLENESMDYLLEIMGKILLCQKIDTPQKEEKYEYRVNFLMKNQKERETIIKYIFEQERRSRQKE
ncbi:MAG: flagellar brake protein [Lachnospiraceae bacterium]|nr:flagellar brake protein [Lachnospiraceae bacterium]